MRIISKAHTVFVTQYSYDYNWTTDPQSGFSFPCTADGRILVEQLEQPAIDNLMKCWSGEFAVVDVGVQNSSYSYLVSAIGRCECGKDVELSQFTNECSCGRLYNGCGQQLVAPRLWEEEEDYD